MQLEVEIPSKTLDVGQAAAFVILWMWLKEKLVQSGYGLSPGRHPAFPPEQWYKGACPAVSGIQGYQSLSLSFSLPPPLPPPLPISLCVHATHMHLYVHTYMCICNYPGSHGDEELPTISTKSLEKVGVHSL